MSETKPEVLELIERGKVLYSADNYEEALKYYKEAQAIDPYFEPVYESQCTCLIMMNRFSEAEDAMKRLLLINKNSGLAHFHLGNIALLENNPSKAKAHYSKAELLGFNNPVINNNLALYFEENAEWDKAAEQYNRMLKMSPFDYEVMERKTQMLLRSEQFPLALKSAKDMVATDIDRAEGHRYVYISFIMLNQLDDARTYLDTALERFPDNQTFRFDKLRLLDLCGKSDEALAYVEQGYVSETEFPQIAFLKLSLLLQKECVNEAIDLVEKTSYLQSDPEALTMMYSIHFAREDYSKALTYCKAISAMGEETPQFYATWYFEPLACLHLGQTAEAKDMFLKASEDLRQICIQHPERVDLNLYRALCEYQLNNYDEAKRLAEFLVAVKPNEAVFHLVLALVLEAKGDQHEAQLHRMKAKELDPNAIAPLV